MSLRERRRSQRHRSPLKGGGGSTTSISWGGRAKKWGLKAAQNAAIIGGGSHSRVELQGIAEAQSNFEQKKDAVTSQLEGGGSRSGSRRPPTQKKKKNSRCDSILEAAAAPLPACRQELSRDECPDDSDAAAREEMMMIR